MTEDEEREARARRIGFFYDELYSFLNHQQAENNIGSAEVMGCMLTALLDIYMDQRAQIEEDEEE